MSALARLSTVAEGVMDRIRWARKGPSSEDLGRVMAAASEDEIMAALELEVMGGHIRMNRVGPMLAQQARTSYSSKGIQPPEDYGAYGKTFQRVVTVYAGIFQIMTHGSGVPINFYRVPSDSSGDDPKSKERVDRHPLHRLLEEPNKEQTGQDLIEETMAWLEISGIFYWGKERHQSLITNELWGLDPNAMKPVPDKATGRIVGYEYQSDPSQRPVPYKRQEVVVHRYFNPITRIFGQGSITAMRDDLETEIWTTLYLNKFFRTGSPPGPIIRTDQNLSETQIEQQLERWRNKHQGHENWHEPDFLTGGAELQDPPTSKEMEFTAARQAIQERILMGLGVPPALVGIFRYANYANSKEQKEFFWQNLVPKLRKLAANINRQLIRPLDPGVRMEFDFSSIGPLQEDQNEVDKRDNEAIGEGWLTDNEARVKRGLKPYPGGDVFRVKSDRVVVGASAEPLGGDVKEEEDRGQPLFQWQVNTGAITVNQMLGRVNLPPLPDGDLFLGEWQRKHGRLPAGAQAFIEDQQAAAAGNGKGGDGERGMGEIIPMDVGRPEERLSPDGSIGRLQAAIEELLPSLDEATRSLAGSLLTYQMDAARRGVNTVEQLGFPLEPFGMDPDQEMINHLAEQGLNKSRWVVRNNFELPLRQALMDGMEARENITQIGTRVEALIRQFDKNNFWAQRIARTELRQAQNYGRLQGLLQSTAETKIWISARGGNIRPEHLLEDTESHENPVPVNQPFPILNAMAPGMSGKARHDINCRCDVAPGPPPGMARDLWGLRIREAQGIWVRGIEEEAPRYIRAIMSEFKKYGAQLLANVKGQMDEQAAMGV